MKFAISKLEQFALTSHLVGQPSPNPEHGRKRLRTWAELGVTELADKLALAVALQLADPGVKPSDWADHAPFVIDLSIDVIEFLLAGTGGQSNGLWADTITRLRDRLTDLRDEKYKLPPELE